MVIYVQTIGTLKSLQEGAKTIKVEVPKGTSVSEILQLLKVPEWEIGFILVNNQRQFKETILQDQDYLTLIAPLAGGLKRDCPLYLMKKKK